MIKKNSIMKRQCQWDREIALSYLNRKENEFVFEDKEVIKCASYGKEIGKSGTSHLQGFLQFVRKRRRQQVSAHFGTTARHFEKRRGTSQEESNYCKKDGDFTTFGSFSLSRTRTDLAQHEIVMDKLTGTPPTTLIEKYDSKYVMHKRKIDETVAELADQEAKKIVERCYRHATKDIGRRY